MLRKISVVALLLAASPCQAKYGAGAASIVHHGSHWYVSVGTARNFDTPSGAEQKALQECSETSHGGECTVTMHFSNGGCGYMVSGTAGSESGHVCWGQGSTPSIATQQCNSRGCDCTDTPIGGCADEDGE